MKCIKTIDVFVQLDITWLEVPVMSALPTQPTTLLLPHASVQMDMNSFKANADSDMSLLFNLSLLHPLPANSINNLSMEFAHAWKIST
jgi:hypothetical protein